MTASASEGVAASPATCRGPAARRRFVRAPRSRVVRRRGRPRPRREGSARRSGTRAGRARRRARRGRRRPGPARRAVPSVPRGRRRRRRTTGRGESGTWEREDHCRPWRHRPRSTPAAVVVIARTQTPGSPGLLRAPSWRAPRRPSVSAMRPKGLAGLWATGLPCSSQNARGPGEPGPQITRFALRPPQAATKGVSSSGHRKRRPSDDVTRG